jgi:hypothetical protein
MNNLFGETIIEPATVCPETFVEYWNSKKVLPQVRFLSDDRKKKLAKRAKNKAFAEFWQQAIDKLAVSDFHLGKNDRGWRANIDWFLRNDTNFVKCLELQSTTKPKSKWAIARESAR